MLKHHTLNQHMLKHHTLNHHMVKHHMLRHHTLNLHILQILTANLIKHKAMVILVMVLTKVLMDHAKQVRIACKEIVNLFITDCSPYYWCQKQTYSSYGQPATNY